jgi:uncharacterized protein (DUF1697 family)
VLYDEPVSVYVALLRGINVGGKNIIPMAALAKTFERLGFANVRTLIASGNVIFEAAKQDPRKLELKIEKALTKAFAYDAKVVVKSRDELAAIVDGMPAEWKKPKPTKRYYVMFLRHAIDGKRVLDELAPRVGVETLSYVPGALLWAANISGLTKSTVARKMLAKPLYQEMTVRNLNTTKKLAELMANR